ncbi:uroporphyrinogen decarboxylase family protein [Moorella sulfitireducens]|uniref:uroporphyrinogen decarboxylase family protein n=1 Tax=Neomoorella sulfitireducens TaxID=2972948 RepID=UPI0021AC37C9|nr:uroporphyrinogen decarboxylase family protein [Moorella sulfitireducens]
MNSRERLLAVLQGQLPDRVPVNTCELQGWKKDDWYNQQPSYYELMEIVRQHTDCIYFWYPYDGRRIGDGEAGLGRFVTATPDVGVQKICWQEGASHFSRYIVHTPLGEISSVERVDEGVNTVWTVEHFIKNEDDLRKVMSIPYVPYRPDTGSLAAARAQLGDRGIITADTGDPLIYIFELFDFSAFLIFALQERELMRRLLDMYFERIYDYLRHLLENGAGPMVRIYGPEVACPPYLPRELFREYVVQYDRQLIDLIHRYNCYCRVHAHGRVGTVLEEFAEMGADALDPVEAPPSGDVTMAEAKRRIGDRVTLFGNMQLKDLETGTEDEIRELTKRLLEEAMPAGRFVLMPTAAPIDVPLKEQTRRNYEAMIETALEYGQY